jgi:hypothetical protein
MITEEILLEKWRELTLPKQQALLEFAEFLNNNSSSQFVRKIRDNLLDELERQHPEYDQIMASSLKEALHESHQTLPMTANEFREWLTEL